MDSIRDVVAKQISTKHGSVILAWSFFLIAIPIFAIPYLLFPPEAIQSQFWWALAARTCTDAAALILFFHALRTSDLSVAIPMISFTPAFLLLTSPLIGEIIPPAGILGVCLIVIGAYVTLSTAETGVWSPIRALVTHKGPRLMLVVALLWTASSTLHRVGIDASNAFTWNFFGAIAIALVLLPLVLARTTQHRTPDDFWWIIAGGAAYAAGDTFLMLALTHGNVAYTMALKRLSILGSVLIGGLLLKEINLTRHLVGASVMVLGAIVILLV